MKIIKRNGSEVQFDINKIINAISKANNEISQDKRLSKDEINKIASNVEECIKGRTLNVEEIQNIVEQEIMALNCDTANTFEIAKKYITYRYTRELARKANSTDEQILSLIECNNEELKQENSNKNPTIISVQRDYMAGEVSKDLTKRILLPKHIVDAHEEGIIHFHDTDYFSQHMHNCFHGSTKFLTSNGIVRFRDCIDGQEVEVRDLNGEWRKATVRKYGKQLMQTVTLESKFGYKIIRCTSNHRWVLENGKVTTNLKVGDKLIKTPCVIDKSIRNNNYFTLGITIILGEDFKTKHNKGITLNINQETFQYLTKFISAGYKVRMNEEGNVQVYKIGDTINEFINNRSWKYMSKEDIVDLVNGMIVGLNIEFRTDITEILIDIKKCKNGLKLLTNIAPIAGYYLRHYDGNLYVLTDYNDTDVFKVVDIEEDPNKVYHDAWCVEEPITKTFTLENGIVTGNCDLVNLEDMLQNGTVISDTMIEKPRSFSTACNIATQIIAQVASSQYGGQSITLSHLAPFVDVSRKKIFAQVKEELKDLNPSDELVKSITEKRVREEVQKGVQTIQYQITTLMTTNGQAPFVTVFMYLNEVEDQYKEDLAMVIEEMLKQRMLGVKNEKGVYVTPAFPKLIYVLEEDNIHDYSKYFYLTELAAKCTSKRLVPDYISEKIMKKLKVDENGEGHCYTTMGCRSILSPYVDPETNKPKYYGRFNQGVVTLNLVDVACSSKGNLENFWEILDERLALCKEALMCRHNRLKGTLSDIAPILWQHGALARLKKGETIDKLLYGGYSTISLGYAGLYECVKYMTGKSHTDNTATPFALEVMEKLYNACEKWKEEENIAFGVYGTPIESTTYKFARCLQKRFGIIEGVTDKGYITNSYHVHVTEEINAFDKLTFEAQFQPLSSGGAISYVEVPNMQNNIDAVITVMRHIYDNIMYAELNTKSDYCMECEYNGEIKIIEDENKLIWECPQCGNRNQDKMSVARRTCGYIGTQFWNQGRTQEIKERVLHL